MNEWFNEWFNDWMNGWLALLQTIKSQNKMRIDSFARMATAPLLCVRRWFAPPSIWEECPPACDHSNTTLKSVEWTHWCGSDILYNIVPRRGKYALNTFVIGDFFFYHVTSYTTYRRNRQLQEFYSIRYNSIEAILVGTGNYHNIIFVSEWL